MCGIAGWFSTTALPEPKSQTRLKAMCDAIAHRGPDDDGYFVKDHVALGMRRLSIVDLQGGHQPMTSADGAIQLVFNGEIFNHTQLRLSLQARGVQFQTSSDTEVILRLYEERGAKAFDALNGMFAVAIFDARDHSLLLVRDRLGVKPLYYSWDGRQLIFASEIKAVIAALGKPPAVNPRAVWDYLSFRYVPAPHTIWNGISKLLPAHRLKISLGAPRPLTERWWSLPRPPRTAADDTTTVERFASLLQNAVDIRMRADVPVGILLSGGLDSSVIAAMAAPSHPKLSTFSVAFEGAGHIDERKWAHLVATQLQTDHQDIVIGRKEFTDFLPDFVYYTDEPLADLASIPLYYVCKLARGNVKVVLSGEGSDEVLGGYSFDVWAQRWDEAASDNTLYQRALRAVGARSNPRFDQGLLDLRQAVQPLTMTSYMSSDAKRHLLLDQGDMPDSLDATRALLRDFGQASPLSQALFTYCQDWLVEDLLMKADKMSMANSLELRTPFLDYRVVEMASRLPDHWRVGRESDGRYSTKRILRHAAASLVPSEIINRPKMGFPVPVYEWLSDELKPLAHDCLCSESTKLRTWFKADGLAELVARGTAIDAANDDRHRLWNAMILRAMVQAVEGMNSLLAVSWTMPPIVLPRSIQISRTLKALGPLGWQSEVISTTVASNVGANIDEEFAKLYCGAYRQHHIEHRESVAASSAWRRLQRRFRPPGNLDEQNWVERSTRHIIRQCRQRKCDVLVTFAQPWIDHLIGLEVRRRRHVPWLAHFSDPWVDSLYYDSSVPEIASKLDVWREQERKIIETADIVVFVTQQTADLVMRKYPPALSRKVRVVPHGFDRDTLTSPPVVERSAELRVTYIGNIYAGTRHPIYLFEAVADMNAKSPLAGRLRLDFYGHCPPEVAAKVTELGIGSVVTFHGTVGYLDSLRIAAEADVLLLIDAPSDLSVFLPSKIVDYLMLKKPILALTPSEGASTDVLSPLGHFVVAPTDKSAMIDTLTGIIARNVQGKPLANFKDDVDGFDIKETTRLFDEALRDAMAVSKQR